MQRRKLTSIATAAKNTTEEINEGFPNKSCQQKQEMRFEKDNKMESIEDVKKLTSQNNYQDHDSSFEQRCKNVFDDILFNGKVEPENKNRKKKLEKCFIAKESPLSELMEMKDIRSLYHIFVAGLILSLFNGAIEEALTGGWQAVRTGIRLIPASFSNFDRALLLWIFSFVTSCFIHPLFKIWNQIRHSITSKFLIWYYDRLCLTLLISYMVLAGTVVVNYKDVMGPASSAFLLLEQTRFFMKIHAFVRSNVVRSPFVPSFRTYLYFLFAPTIVYRDSYPRTSHIRWPKICGWIFEFFGSILMLSCIVELKILPEYYKFGLEKQTKSSLVALVSRTILPASLFMLSGFFLFLHAWSNAWAELLRFADRRFYGPWWNSTSYFEFYRTWNGVVHDYLYTYIYKEVRTYTSSATAAKLTVFVVSAIVHEYIISLMLGFCYPVLFIEFLGLGMVLAFVKGIIGTGKTANLLLFVSLGWGIGIQISLYSMEAFARINCPKTNSDFIDFFIPRSWTCNGLDM